jgi:hypothetical protein
MSTITYELLLQDKKTDGSIANWVSNDSIPPLAILRMAEQWIAKHLRIRQMTELSTGSFEIGQNNFEVESRLIRVESLRIIQPLHYALIATSFPELQDLQKRTPAGALEEDNPTYFSFRSGVIQFDVSCVQSMSYELLGLYALEPLSSTNTVNYLTEQALDVLMFSCAGFASEYLRDPEESSRQLSIAKAGIDRLNAVHGMALRNINHAVSALY